MKLRFLVGLGKQGLELWESQSKGLLVQVHGGQCGTQCPGSVCVGKRTDDVSGQEKESEPKTFNVLIPTQRLSGY